MAIVRRQLSLLRPCGVASDTARRDERNPVVASSMHPVLQMISNKRRTGVIMRVVVSTPRTVHIQARYRHWIRSCVCHTPALDTFILEERYRPLG
jgi:hypothetical protein